MKLAKRPAFFSAIAMLWIVLGMLVLGVLVEHFSFVVSLAPDSVERMTREEAADIGLELGEDWLYRAFEASDIPRARPDLTDDSLGKLSALRHDASGVEWESAYPSADLEIYIADTSYDKEIFNKLPPYAIPVIPHQLPSEENEQTGRYFYYVRSSAGVTGKNLRTVCEELLEFVVEGPFQEFKGATRIFYRSKTIPN